MRTLFFTIFLMLFFGFFTSCSKKQIAFNDPEKIKWKSNSPQTAKTHKKENRSTEKSEVSEVSASTATEPVSLDSETSSNKSSGNTGLLIKYQEARNQNKSLSKADLDTKKAKEGESSKLTRKEKRKLKKVVKKAAKNQDIETNTLLLIIIAILLPPVAVGLIKGWGSGAFWLNLALTLLTVWLGGIIHALYIIFSGE